MLNFFSKKANKEEAVADEKKQLPDTIIEPIEEKKNESNELKKSEQLQKQLNNLFLVNELSQRITSSLSVEESFGHLYHTINSMMDASVVELLVYRDDETRLFYSNKRYADADLQLSKYNHMSEWCLKNKKEIFLEDAENDFGRYVFNPLILPDKTAAQSVMIFPVYHLEKIAGTLCIISFTKNAFELFHKEIIGLLLPFIGVAINNAFNHQQILDLKQRAESSEKFMQQFLANMSHEIRTPINAVTGMTRLLLEKNPRSEQLKYLESIRNASDSLLVIINDILDLSKIEAGKIELEKIDFSVFDLINNVKEIMQFKAEEKGLILHTTIDEKIPSVLIGDPTRLTQILINLVGNGIKFTEKGKVHLSLTLSTGEGTNVYADVSPPLRGGPVGLSFSVKDTGIGMTSEQQQKLFQNYSQASTDTARKYGGTGLGLSISKQLVQLQGGNIEVQSRVGEGSIFSFSISYPISKNKTVARKEKTVSKEMLKQLNGIKILLADDNEYNRIVAKETLELKIENVKVDEAFDGIIACEMILKNEYDIVLMDLVMPNMNGLEATEKIRKEFAAPKSQIQILALTASVIKSEIDKCYASGMNGFIPKPFKSFELFGAIYNAMHGEVILEEVIMNSEEIVLDKNKLVDLNYLKEFTEGDTERLQRYIDLFLTKIPTSIDNLKSSLEKNDLEKIRITSHSMKPQLRFMGILKGLEIAETIEQNCVENVNTNQLPKLIEELKIICEKAIEELKVV